MIVGFLFSVSTVFAQSPVTMTELVGTWRSGCVARSGGSTVSQLGFNIRGEMKNVSHVHVGTVCASPFMTADADFDFELGPDRLSGTGAPTAASLKFESADAIAAANAGGGVCGLNDWVLNVARPILGLACSPATPVRIGVGKAGAKVIRVTECPAPNACTTTDYRKVD